MRQGPSFEINRAESGGTVEAYDYGGIGGWMREIGVKVGIGWKVGAINNRIGVDPTVRAS